MKIKKVHVIFKTHLDIGFTDTAENVKKTYFENYIPLAMSNAKLFNSGENKKFIWTVGSWLIDEALEYYKGEQLEVFKEALVRGDIRWHSLPYTTHTELLTEELMNYCLSISKKLDKQFGKTTIAAKMTDVPGHTIALVDHLSKSGSKFLHIGVNPASLIPEVPDVFKWRYEDSEIIVAYAKTYGNDLVIENFDEVLVFAHSDDNNGPQQENEIIELYKNLELKYPGALILASTLDDYANSLIKADLVLPVITKEIGDTWIHGVATDPDKVSRYRRLCEKVNSNKSLFSPEELDNIYKNLALVCEHTWGMDTKLYLANYINYDFESFNELLKDNKLFNRKTEKHDFIKSFSLTEDETANKNIVNVNIEDSWSEQLSYIEEVERIVNKKIPVSSEAKESLSKAEKTTFSLGDFQIETKNNHFKIFKNNKLIIDEFALNFKENGAVLFDKWVDDYVRNFENTKHWSLADQAKPGLELAEDSQFTSNYTDFQVSELYETKDGFYTTLINENKMNKIVIPQELGVFFELKNNNLHVNWAIANMEKNRWPMEINVTCKSTEEIVSVKKIGKNIDINNIIENGGKNISCVEEIMYDSYKINNVDTPLFSLSDNFHSLDAFPKLSKTKLTFNVYNNSWGTNFPMWINGNLKTEFIIK